MQDNHPIAYISKPLSLKHQGLSSYEKELLAILFAVKKWHCYMIARPFVIRTDQQSLKHMLKQKISTPLQHTWLAKLLGFDYEIVYKAGRENIVAHALSRLPETTQLATITISCMPPVLLAQIQDSWRLDVNTMHLIEALKQAVPNSNFSWRGDIIRRRGKIVVGLDSSLRKELLDLMHRSAMGATPAFTPPPNDSSELSIGKERNTIFVNTFATAPSVNTTNSRQSNHWGCCSLYLFRLTYSHISPWTSSSVFPSHASRIL